MNNRLQSQLPTMFALAHEHTEHSRLELADMLADVFLTQTDLSLREEELINELIEQLLRNHSLSLRTKIVEKFPDLLRMPRKFALSLANDTIDVAYEILKNSPALHDQDLITIIANKGSDHAQAIAQRQSIAIAVADALVTTGDIKVMQLVAENLGAKLSPMALNVLAEAARYTATLHKPVMHRPEMTQEVAIELYWWLSQELRRLALERFDISAGQVDEALAKTIAEFLGYHELEKNKDEVMEQVANWLDERQVLSPAILPQVLRLGHFHLFNILLSRLTKTSPSLVSAIVAETGGRGLAVLCRAIGVDKAAFVSLFLLSRGARPDEQIVHPRELSNALAAFDRITAPVAHDMLHSWKVNPDYLSERADTVVC